MNTFKWHTQKVTTRVARCCASRRQPMFGTRCVSRHSSFGARQPVSQIMRGPGPRRPYPALHCGDWCTPLVTTLELQTQCSPLFVLCTQNFLKLIAEVLTMHIESLYEQSMIIVLCSSLSTSDVITLFNTQHSTASSVLLSTVHRRTVLPLSSSVMQTRHEQGRSRPCLFSAKFQRWLFLIAEEKKEREQASGTCEVLQIFPNTSRRYNRRSSLEESCHKQAAADRVFVRKWRLHRCGGGVSVVFMVPLLCTRTRIRLGMHILQGIANTLHRTLHPLAS